VREYGDMLGWFKNGLQSKSSVISTHTQGQPIGEISNSLAFSEM
jgi:hypothetical protein